MQVFLAKAGVASRRHSAVLIQAGRVRVNGAVVSLPGYRVGREETVTVDGREIAPGQKKVYYLFHKPFGVVTTLDDPQGRKCLNAYFSDLPQRVFPVGRLDADSEGLLLLTNDGDAAHLLTHPRFGVVKQYRVWVAGKIRPEVVAQVRHGVVLDDGPAIPASVRLVAATPLGSLLELKMREGRKREIRRMLAGCGQRVTRLMRTGIGPLELGNLPPGARRALNEAEVERLLALTGRGKRDRGRVGRRPPPNAHGEGGGRLRNRGGKTDENPN